MKALLHLLVLICLAGTLCPVNAYSQPKDRNAQIILQELGQEADDYRKYWDILRDMEKKGLLGTKSRKSAVQDSYWIIGSMERKISGLYEGGYDLSPEQSEELEGMSSFAGESLLKLLLIMRSDWEELDGVISKGHLELDEGRLRAWIKEQKNELDMMRKDLARVDRLIRDKIPTQEERIAELENFLENKDRLISDIEKDNFKSGGGKRTYDPKIFRAEAEDPSSMPPVPDKKINILIVDDDVTGKVLTLMTVLDPYEHISTSFAASYQEALSKIRTNRYKYQFIFMDTFLDPSDVPTGLELIKVLRQEGINTPIIGIGHVLGGFENMFRQGLDGYLVPGGDDLEIIDQKIRTWYQMFYPAETPVSDAIRPKRTFNQQVFLGSVDQNDPPDNIPLRAMKVLLVSSQEDGSGELSRLFERKYNLDIEAASSGTKALMMIRKNKYDVVFVGRNIGSFDDGISIVRSFRSENKSIPVIGIGEEVDTDRLERLFAAGMDGYCRLSELFDIRRKMAVWAKNGIISLEDQQLEQEPGIQGLMDPVKTGRKRSVSPQINRELEKQRSNFNSLLEQAVADSKRFEDERSKELAMSRNNSLLVGVAHGIYGLSGVESDLVVMNDDVAPYSIIRMSTSGDHYLNRLAKFLSRFGIELVYYPEALIMMGSSRPLYNDGTMFLSHESVNYDPGHQKDLINEMLDVLFESLWRRGIESDLLGFIQSHEGPLSQRYRRHMYDTKVDVSELAAFIEVILSYIREASRDFDLLYSDLSAGRLTADAMAEELKGVYANVPVLYRYFDEAVNPAWQIAEVLLRIQQAGNSELIAEHYYADGNGTIYEHASGLKIKYQFVRGKNNDSYLDVYYVLGNIEYNVRISDINRAGSKAGLRELFLHKIDSQLELVRAFKQEFEKIKARIEALPSIDISEDAELGLVTGSADMEKEKRAVRALALSSERLRRLFWDNITVNTEDFRNVLLESYNSRKAVSEEKAVPEENTVSEEKNTASPVVTMKIKTLPEYLKQKALSEPDLVQLIDYGTLGGFIRRAKTSEEVINIELLMEKVSELELSGERIKALTGFNYELEAVRQAIMSSEKADMESQDAKAVLCAFLGLPKTSSAETLADGFILALEADINGNGGKFSSEALALVAREDVLSFVSKSTKFQRVFKLTISLRELMEIESGSYSKVYYKKPEFETFKKELLDIRAIIKK